MTRRTFASSLAAIFGLAAVPAAAELRGAPRDRPSPRTPPAPPRIPPPPEVGEANLYLNGELLPPATLTNKDGIYARLCRIVAGDFVIIDRVDLAGDRRVDAFVAPGKPAGTDDLQSWLGPFEPSWLSA